MDIKIASSSDFYAGFTPSLRQRALAAYRTIEAEEQAAAAAQEAEKNARDAECLKATLGRILGIEAEPTSDTIEIEGLIFRLHRHYRDDWLDLMGRCARCNNLFERSEIKSLEALGKVLASQNKKPGLCKQCLYATSQQQRDPSPAEQLVEALRAFIKDAQDE